MENLSLRTRLFLSCFLVSALLFCGTYFYLKGYNARREDQRAVEAFSRALHLFDTALAERQARLDNLAQLAAHDEKLRASLRKPNSPALREAAERLGVQAAFLLDQKAEIVRASFDSPALGNDSVKQYFQSARGQLSLLNLDGAIFQLAFAPFGKHRLGLAIRLVGPGVDRLSGPFGLFHLFAGGATQTPGGNFVASPMDLARIEASLQKNETRVSIANGRYLIRAHPATSAPRLVLLFPLAEFEQASRELLGAFFASGLALLFLSGIFSHLLAREVLRPLNSLRHKVLSIAESMGFEPPQEGGDEVREIAASFLDVAGHMHTAFEHKKLALYELELYKADLLRANSNLHRRLFQLKVLLSIWSERDKALDVKDFLSRFLEVLLPGLPFEYGCVMIRPIAEMSVETIFAKKIHSSPGDFSEDHESLTKGTQWTDIIDPEVKEFLQRESNACIHSQTVNVSTVQGRMGHASAPAALTVVSLRLKQGEEPLGSLHFLTEQASPVVHASLKDFLLSLSAQVAAQLHIQALSAGSRVDPLTRLYNRGYLNDRLREEVVRTARSKQSFTLLLIDIDRFVQFNQRHGRRAGDEVLRGLATLLKKICRGSDTVCRLSGATMGILLADTPLAGAKIFAENVRKAVETETFQTSAGPIQVTIGQGLAEFPHHGVSGEALMARAEQALLEAKLSGLNKWKAAA